MGGGSGRVICPLPREARKLFCICVMKLGCFFNRPSTYSELHVFKITRQSLIKTLGVNKLWKTYIIWRSPGRCSYRADTAEDLERAVLIN